MEDAEPPNTVPHLNIQQEITPLAARDYLQARDEAVVTPIPPFRVRGNSAFLYYNPGKEGVCACSSAEHAHVHLLYIGIGQKNRPPFLRGPKNIPDRKMGLAR